MLTIDKYINSCYNHNIFGVTMDKENVRLNKEPISLISETDALDIAFDVNKEIANLYKDVAKLLSALDYDKRENERLRFNIEHLLDIDVLNDNPKTFIDILFRFALWRNEKRFIRFTKRKFYHIRSAIEQNDGEYLLNATYNNTSIFDLRDELAQQRYDTLELLNTPGSALAKGTIVNSFLFMEEQWKRLKDVADEIKTHLDKTIEFNDTLNMY